MGGGYVKNEKGTTTIDQSWSSTSLTDGEAVTLASGSNQKGVVRMNNSGGGTSDCLIYFYSDGDFVFHTTADTSYVRYVYFTNSWEVRAVDNPSITGGSTTGGGTAKGHSVKW